MSMPEMALFWIGPLRQLGGLVHQLPDLLDRFGIAADQQRLEVFLDEAFHRHVAIGEGGTTQADTGPAGRSTSPPPG